MTKSDRSLKLIKKNDSTLFGQFLEKFESENLTTIYITTLKQYEGFVILLDCLDKKFFSDENLIDDFVAFGKNNTFKSITFVKFKDYNEKDDIEFLIKELMIYSEELMNQKETVAIELPTTNEKLFDLKTNFSKTFISTNQKNKKILFLTNDKSLIKLYEKLQ